MRIIFGVVALGLLAAVPRPAAAVGCLSGAVAGGVAGHYAGHHGLLGAAGGCVVGHHMHKVQQQRAREQSEQQPDSSRGYSQTGYSNPSNVQR